MEPRIIEGRVFFDQSFDDKRSQIYNAKFNELRDQMNEVLDDMSRVRNYLVQIAHGYLTTSEKSELAKAAIKLLNERQ